MGSTKYITSMGELSRKDNSLCFRKNNKNIYLPIENIKEIYCMNEISINTKLLDYISNKHIVIHFFNYYGNYSGTFYPRDKYNSGKLLVKEVEAYSSDKRIIIVKKIVKAISINIDVVLYHYYKHNHKEVKQTIDWIRKNFNSQLNELEDIQNIMLLEGELWARFYSTFKYILPDDFMMNKRVRRPPDNPINALISFGNSLLYTKCISVIYQTHLN
jgi:CRISPR-associated protein Cas1